MTMQRLVAVWSRLERATDAAEQRALLADYFADAASAEIECALRLLVGRRPKRLFSKDDVRRLTRELSGLPDWLYAESEAAAGDAIDAAALLLGRTEETDGGLLRDWLDELRRLADVTPAEREEWARRYWRTLSVAQLRWLLRLTSSASRPRVAQRALAEALAECFDLPPWLAALRLTEGVADADAPVDRLAAPADIPPPDTFLMPSRDAERRQPIHGHCVMPLGLGSRVFLLRRGGRCLFWSSDGEFVSAPAVARAARLLPADTVIDGELVVGGSAPYLLAHDLLEHGGRDLRGMPLRMRQRELAALVHGLPASELRLGPYRHVDTWDDVDRFWQIARELNAEALMIRPLDGVCPLDDPSVCRRYRPAPQYRHAVLLYARMNDPEPELTVGLWRGRRLVPVVRTRVVLPDDERQALTQWIRANAVERFGPVRSVPPAQVFVLRFQGVKVSKRHKAGLVLREPVIERWLRDAAPADADTLDSLLVAG